MAGAIRMPVQKLRAIAIEHGKDPQALLDALFEAAGMTKPAPAVSGPAPGPVTTYSRRKRAVGTPAPQPAVETAPVSDPVPDGGAAAEKRGEPPRPVSDSPFKSGFDE